MPFAALMLLCALALLSERLQGALRRLMQATPALVFVASAGVTAIFAAASAYEKALSAPLIALVFAYAMAPALCLYVAGVSSCGRAGWLDLAAILLLWLPLELAAGAPLVPKPAQGALHAVAYGCGILLALVLFLIFRSLNGMKYNLPRSARDLRNAAAGFGVAAVVLIPVGLWTGFMSPHHGPDHSAGAILLRLMLILLGTALPEEILFRSLIQNWLMQRLGSSNVTIAISALIFGCAHLNNGPQTLPNWRYAIVATMAGLIFGKVFQKSTSISASALAHTGVDGVKWAWF